MRLRRSPSPRPAADAAHILSRRLTRGERLLGCILCDPRLGLGLQPQDYPIITDDLGPDPLSQVVADRVIAFLHDHGRI